MTRAELMRKIQQLRQEAAEWKRHASENPQAAPARLTECFDQLQSLLSHLEQLDAPHDLLPDTPFAADVNSSQDRLRAILENSSDSVSVVNAMGHTKWASPSSVRLLGYSMEETIGQSLYSLLHPLDLPKMLQLSVKILAHPGTCYTSVVRCRHKNGSWRLIEARATNLLNNPVVRGVVLNCRDITETRQQSTALEIAQFALETTSDAVYWVRSDGSFEYVNDAACRGLEYTREELMNLRVSDIDPTVPPERWEETWNATYKNEHRLFESRHRTKSGREFPVEVSANYLKVGDLEYHCDFVRNITARHEAAELLRETRHRLQAATEAGRVGLVDWNLEDNSLVVSPEWKSMMGYTEEDVVNRIEHFDKHLHPDDGERLLNFRRHLLTSSILSTEIEIRLLHKDGTYRNILSRTRILRRPDNTPYRAFVCQIDITDRKQIEDALRRSHEDLERRVQDRTRSLQESEARYRAVVEDQTEVICRFAPDGTLSFVNDIFCRFFGKRREELLGQKWQPVAVREDLRLVEQKLATLSPANPVVVIENRVYSGTGEVRWVQFVNRGFFDATGRLQEIQAVGRDITERKQAQDDLFISEERFRQMAESLDDVIWMFNLDFTECLYINRAYEIMFGRSCDSLRQNPMSFIDIIHPEDRFFAREVLEEKLKKGIEFNVEVRIIHTDGSLLWVTIRAFPILDANGRPYRMAGVIHDITARRRLEEALLDVAEREQQRIAQDLHDGLCNQLAGLNYLTKGLEKTLTGKSKTAATEISLQLRNAMEQARGIARGLHPITIAPASLLDALGHLAKEQSALYGVTCRFRPSSLLPPLSSAKATHLYRIAQEAVHNAIKHGKSKQITIQLSVKDHSLTLSVRDNGIGYSLPTSTPTGIGTQIMRHRADTIGGHLTIERAKQTGTVVTCTLPLLDAKNPKGSDAS